MGGDIPGMRAEHLPSLRAMLSDPQLRTMLHDPEVCLQMASDMQRQDLKDTPAHDGKLKEIQHRMAEVAKDWGPSAAR
eukprot:NODE_5172_length_321_cov_174.025735_g4561_i0.p2 GENE.NODE_5172_length_321_cov_174.025735_g4561_i0~~NODE_5172_length_321_cov_174.025735_g4561_i0.p2  ORF type:complete len:85 (+),score=27.71 NODE_5172_length_321_cov_174.025735_g4561_i0:22-255(+)